MNLHRGLSIVLAILLLSLNGTSLRADDLKLNNESPPPSHVEAGAGESAPVSMPTPPATPRPVDRPRLAPCSDAPTGPITAVASPDNQEQNTSATDDVDSTPAAPSEEMPTAPVSPEPVHYSMDDLVSSIHSLGPDRSDSSHHSMSEISGL